jgi:large subunit ribosomal protein L13
MEQIKYNAAGKSMGRAASDVARFLMGKNRTDYAPNKVIEGTVIVEGIDKMVVTGRKLTQKKYYRHSGYLGNIKEKSLQERKDENISLLFREMVARMLPANKLLKKRLAKLQLKE